MVKLNIEGVFYAIGILEKNHNIHTSFDAICRTVCTDMRGVMDFS